MQRRLYMLLTVALVLTLLPAVAFAKGKPAKPRDGFPCGPNYDQAIVLTGGQIQCRDVSTSIAGYWEFDVAMTGRVTELFISIRDSTPGDFCYAERWRSKALATLDAADGTIDGRFTVSTDPTLISTELDACGVEWTDKEDDGNVLLVSVTGNKRARTEVSLRVVPPPG